MLTLPLGPSKALWVSPAVAGVTAANIDQGRGVKGLWKFQENSENCSTTLGSLQVHFWGPGVKEGGVKGWVTARAHAQLVKMIFVAALQQTIFVRDLLGFSTCDSLIRYECVYFQSHKYGNPESTPSHPHPLSKFVCFCLHNALPKHVIPYDTCCSCPTPSGGHSSAVGSPGPSLFWSLWGQPVVFSEDTFIVGLLSYKALVSHCAELALIQCCARQHSCCQKTQGYTTNAWKKQTNKGAKNKNAGQKRVTNNKCTKTILSNCTLGACLQEQRGVRSFWTAPGHNGHFGLSCATVS